MDELRQAWANFWDIRSEQEKKILAVVGSLLLAGLIYLLLLEPALSGRKMLERQLPNLRMQAAQLQELVREAQALSGRAGPPATALSKEAVESSLNQRLMKAQNIGMVGDQVKLQLNEVQFGNLLSWLDEMQKSSHISVLDANIVSQATPGVVNATLSLRQLKSEEK